MVLTISTAETLPRHCRAIAMEVVRSDSGAERANNSAANAPIRSKERPVTSEWLRMPARR